MAIQRTIIGLGEALFDVFPDASRPGGAPTNVAIHAHQLGNAGIPATRVGQDDLGTRLIRELKERGISTEYVQTDPDRPTGIVEVRMDSAGEPVYRIVEQAAWDFIQFDPDLEYLARQCHAVCFGTLAQRVAQTRNTIYRFCTAATRAIRLLDINLRQNFYDRQIITRSLEFANALKLNQHEMARLVDLLNLPERNDLAASALLRKYGLGWIALTRGPEGTLVYTADRCYESERVAASAGGDPVGAGDACAAALLHGASRQWEWPRTVRLANTIGAYVASQPGACPSLTDEIHKLAE